MPPTTLINSLGTIRRRVKLLGVAYGVGIAMAVAVAGLLVATFIDYLLNLPPVPRLVIELIAIGALAHVLWWHVLRPAMAKLSLSDIAGKLEQSFPQFDDRLRSTVNFVSGKVPGSEVMQERVVGETTTLASRLDLNRAVVAAPAFYSMSAGIACVSLLILAAAFVINPIYRDVALARLFSPFGNHVWPKRVQIDVLGQLPQRLPVGQRLDVRMKLAKGDRASMKAIVYYQYDDGPVMQEFMTRGADGTYSASLDTRVEGEKSSTAMKVWMRAGDDERQAGAVTVVPRLSIKSVEATITPPPYVQQSQQGELTSRVNLASAPAIMAVGSRVSLRVQFNKSLADPKQVQIVPVESPEKAPQIDWNLADRNAAIGTFVARESLRFHVRATDTDGFSNSAVEEFELVVRPDQSPSIQIENPRRSEERTANAVVPMQAVAEDDYGVQSLKLVVERLTDKKHWEIPLVQQSKPLDGVNWARAEASAERQRFRMNYDWDLAKLEKADLKSGDVLEYYLLVADNFALDGQTHDPVPSGKLRITIISQEDLANRIIEELRNIKDQIASAKNTETRIKNETANLQADTKDKPQFDPADRAAAERLNNQQVNSAASVMSLANRVQNLASKLEENKSPSKELKDLTRDVKSDLDRAADGPMKEAAKDLSNANQPNQDKEKRDQAMTDAQAEQSKATEQLQQAMDRMTDIGTLAQTIDRIAQILAEQKEVSKQTADAGRNNLGKKPEDMKADDRKKLDDASDKQSKLADRTSKATSDMAKMAEQMKKSDPSSSQAMQKANQTAQQQNVQKNQQQAAQNAKQNQQSQAQSNQKQAELGLEMMLNELREAEKARLAELSKKLEELQKQIANLIRRQAGHNLDNLTIQGPEIVAKLQAEQRDELSNLAERDPGATTQPNANAPKLPQLSQSQQQTERNTRDIGKSAEAMPNGAEPAANLTRAAGKMERAIFSLQDNKLPEAYDPSQVEALAALQQAKKLVDEQKNKVDEQMAENDREAIKQQYVKIKEEQEKLNVDTTRIDKSRDPKNNNELPRNEAIRLGQLPGEQGKLADRISAIDKDLAAVGSIVYIWANKDIAAAMNGVKGDLGKPDTGGRTQDDQKRIVAQLDAMIRNLSIKPLESKFAQDQQGGQSGQGQGGSKLPTEAELRLLKDLQLVINGDTKSIDDQAKAGEAKDKPRLQALGTRQKDLRGLLDGVIKKASSGEMKLGPEPDKIAQLPEEANEDDLDKDELQQSLLHDKPANNDAEAEKMMRVGDRMARSRQRLALNDDPGRVTQLIQKRIVDDLDVLAEQARQQQAQTRNSKPNPGNKGEQMQQPGDKPGQAQNQGTKPGQANQQQATKSNTPASDEHGPRQSGPTDLSKAINDLADGEWGTVSPRVREAVLQGADDQVLDEYRKLVEDYWKALSSKSKDK